VRPYGHFVASYLRPETAQGMFVNFRYLLEYNNGQMVRARAGAGPDKSSGD